VRNLLRPGWLALTLVVIIFATACFALLSPWQFARHHERKATNDAITSSFVAAPEPWNPALREWRTVTLAGQYLPESEAIVRLRTVQGTPASEVLTPFRLTDGRIVLVDRGFVRPEQGVQLPPYPAAPSGQVALQGRLRVDESDLQHREAYVDTGRLHVYAVDSRAVAAATKTTIEPGYVQLSENSPGVLGALPLPELDAGPFLSYALQWIAFGAMAILGWMYFTWRELKPGGALATERPRRRSVADMVAEEEAAERAATAS
jgi:cytochrome oxidase assembly protein ShyY1